MPSLAFASMCATGSSRQPSRWLPDMSALLDEFLAEECNAYVVGRIRDEARAGGSGKRYLTFNRFNVRLDLDSGVATVEDELDP